MIPKIKMLIVDVDGTLTDGGVYVDENGKESKKFNVKDGIGMMELQKHGVEIGIISNSERGGAILSRAKYLGIKDLNKKYNIDDMVRGDVIFCATGVTDGDIVTGIKDCGDSFESETFVLHKSSKTIKKIRNISKK